MTWETVTLAAVGIFAAWVATLEIRDTRRARHAQRELDQLVRAKRILGIEAGIADMERRALHEARLQRAFGAQPDEESS